MTGYNNLAGNTAQDQWVASLKERTVESRYKHLMASGEVRNLDEEVRMAKLVKEKLGLIEVYNFEVGGSLFVSADKKQYVMGDTHFETINLGEDETFREFRFSFFVDEDDLLEQVKEYFDLLTTKAEDS